MVKRLVPALIFVGITSGLSSLLLGYVFGYWAQIVWLPFAVVYGGIVGCILAKKEIRNKQIKEEINSNSAVNSSQIKGIKEIKMEE